MKKQFPKNWIIFVNKKNNFVQLPPISKNEARSQLLTGEKFGVTLFLCIERGGLSRMFSRTCLANVSRHEEGEIVNVKIWRRNSCHSVAGMNAHLTNGFLMFALAIVATMRDDATVLGYSGAPLVMDQDIPLRTCRYSRIHSMIQVRCANLGLERIPSNLKTEIQVRELIFGT